MSECSCDYTNYCWVKNTCPVSRQGKFGYKGIDSAGARQGSEQTSKWELLSCGKPRQNRNDGQYNRKENKYSVTKEFATFAFRIPPTPTPLPLNRHISRFSREMSGCKPQLFKIPLPAHYKQIRPVQRKTCYHHLINTVISTALISPSKMLAVFQGITVVWLKIQACRNMYDVSTGKGSLTFRRNVVPSSSKRRQLLGLPLVLVYSGESRFNGL